MAMACAPSGESLHEDRSKPNFEGSRPNQARPHPVDYAWRSEILTKETWNFRR